MDCQLSEVESRVLGCLMEKEMATPDYYPLSLNGLMNACNQKSNRNPVVDYDEKTVYRALDELKQKQFVWQSDASRVPKYGENFVKKQNLVAREAAVLCLLLVRGFQTAGEIRGRAGRLCEFADLAEAESALQSLAEMGLVVKMPRQPGCKERRYAHLLAGEPVAEIEGISVARPEAVALEVMAENERIAALENEVKELRFAFEQLQQNFAEFKEQFD
ncbi:MAG: YceH family protein [Proteobacteria bacterium]|nr:YceH family protein [Pseudomonadota bacterium]MBU1709969.1 YceH family protein [Pseudomonadota bacterium]